MESNLPNLAKQVRRDILEMVFAAGSGHLAGPLSSTDLLVSLYFGGVLTKRDKFVLSAGHYCPALYSVLARAGFFPERELKTFREIGTRLQGHPRGLSLPGIETSSGPLGQGLSQSAGIALGWQMDGESKDERRVYCLMSDAEQQEGQIWEAVMLAAKYKLSNLVGIIDCNGIQIDGATEEIMPLGDLSLKYHSFGWEVFSIDGHNFSQILEALASTRTNKDRPTVIIARTIAGKGVSFMEGKWEWHAGSLSKKQFEKAMKELS